MTDARDVRYTPAAERDLDRIARYLARFRGREFALDYVRELQSKADTLCASPLRYREREWLGKGCRLMPVLPYHIYYRVETDHVLVLRIMHGRRNVTRHQISRTK